MALTFKIYSDSGLVTEADPVINQASDGTTGAVDIQLWLGSNTASKQLQASSSPGVDNIVVSIADSAPAAGQAASSIKLALTQAGLTAATAGASLDLGEHTAASGVGNAITFWARVTASLLTGGTYTDLSLALADVIESAA